MSIQPSHRTVLSRTLVVAAASLVAALAADGTADAGATYTAFDAPGAGTGAYEGTTAVAINDSDEIAGQFESFNDKYHGFFRAADGTITTFDPFGSTNTFVGGISRKGMVVGAFSDRNGQHGFLRNRKGRIKAIDVPGASTFACGINSAGVTTGSYQTFDSFGGFIRQADGTITTFAPEGATQVNACSINDGGTTAGWYGDSNGAVHGFIRTPDGTITPFDPPQSTQTFTCCIDAANNVTGVYADANGVHHGFLRTPDGTIVPFDPAGTVDTDVNGIGSRGIVGEFTDDSGGTHAFVRRPNGAIKIFDAPHAMGTFAYGIDEKGDIAGTYIDRHFVYHGYLRTVDHAEAGGR